jgi:hypothetical protein
MQTLWWFFWKNRELCLKNAEFHADFESVEKVVEKTHQKRLLAKTCRKYPLFSLLLVFVNLVLFITFLVRFLTTFSTDSKLAWNSAFFSGKTKIFLQCTVYNDNTNYYFRWEFNYQLACFTCGTCCPCAPYHLPPTNIYHNSSSFCLHWKKRLAIFPSPAGIPLTKHSLAGNY